MNYQSVLRTINSTDPDTAYLVVADQNGKQQTIVSDSKHPYFAQYGTDPTPPQPSPGKPYHGDIANAYWVNAANLETGHKLIDDSGNWQTVVSVRVEPKPLNSYNLEVENDHTFFIRGLGGDAGIWVHNQDCWRVLPKGWKKTRETTSNGKPIYIVTDNSTGKKVEIAQANDGIFYKLDKYPPDNTSSEYLRQSPYDSHRWRASYEQGGAKDVKSTTFTPNTQQRVNSDPGKNIEVIDNGQGHRAVRVTYNDPVTDQLKTANIPYDKRGLPIFDDVAKYTGKLKMEKFDKKLNRMRKLTSEEQKADATRQLKEAIDAGKVNRSEFNAMQLRAIYNEKPQIPGYTWHHNAQSAPNNMQLVPFDVHDPIRHTGQQALSQGR